MLRKLPEVSLMTFQSGKLRYAGAFFCAMLALHVAAQQVDNPGQTPMKDAATVAQPGPMAQDHVENPSNTPLNSGPTGQQHVDNPGQTPPAAPIGDAVVGGGGANGISYHGGPVLKGNPVPFYLIWYGNWSGSGSNTAATVNLVERFVNTLGGTPYENIGTTYGDSTGNVSGNVSLGGATFVASSTNLTDSSLQTVITNTLKSGALPTNTNGVYFVISSSNINETSGFCQSYCSFHTHAILNGVDIKYVFVGNPDRCPSGCEFQTTGPNSPSTGSGGADGIVYSLASKQFDSITDPDFSAWFDSSGNEAGDKCLFKFTAPLGTCTAGSSCSAAADSFGSKYNVCFGGLCWLLPELWENANGGKCVLHL
jgi:hypothetical protein